jgi:GTP-binding protein
VRSEFVISSPDLAGRPELVLPEFAFIGRSNCGKSSLINHFLDRTNLAHTSGKPGKTRLLNYFLVDERYYLVDLPGYGFAKVPLAVKLEWTKQLENYLQKRASLRGLILLMDVRHPMQPFDQQMLNWALSASMPVHILLTKSDKLKRGPASATLLKVRADLAPYQELATVQLFSALKHEGKEELVAVLDAWLTDISVYEEEQAP